MKDLHEQCLAAGIRRMEFADNPAVAQVIRTVMTEFGAVGEGFSINDPEVDAMFESYDESRSRFWVVAKDDRILGCGGIAPLAGAGPTVCELRKMYFLDDLRGLGIGKLLLKLCLLEAKALGYETCYLETLRTMTAAAALYERMGFEPRTSALGATGHSACDRWMALSLTDFRLDP